MIEAFGNRGYRRSLGRLWALAQSEDDRAQRPMGGLRGTGQLGRDSFPRASGAQQDELSSFITSPPINQCARNALRFPIVLERFISSGASLGCGYLRMYRVCIISAGPLALSPRQIVRPVWVKRS